MKSILSALSFVHDKALYWRIERRMKDYTNTHIITLPIKGLPNDEDDIFADLDEEYGSMVSVAIKDTLIHAYFTHHGVCKLSSVKHFCGRIRGDTGRFDLIQLVDGNMLALEFIDDFDDDFCYRLVTRA